MTEDVRMRATDIKKLAKKEHLDKDYREISRYVQHFTVCRSNRDRGWNVDEMFNRILPVIEAFEAGHF